MARDGHQNARSRYQEMREQRPTQVTQPTVPMTNDNSVQPTMFQPIQSQILSQLLQKGKRADTEKEFGSHFWSLDTTVVLTVVLMSTLITVNVSLQLSLSLEKSWIFD